MKVLLSAMLLFSVAGSCVSQTAPPPERVLQSILVELRAIHADMRADTARSQDMQLLLAELQIQAATVTRTTERLDAARSKTAVIQEGIRRTAADISRVEDARNAASTENDKATIASNIERLESNLSSLKRQEQDCISNQQQAEAALQKAQNVYDAIEDQLSALVKALSPAQDAGK